MTTPTNPNRDNLPPFPLPAPVRIYGQLIGPMCLPEPNATIELVAISTTWQMVSHTAACTTTDSQGNYDMQVLPGTFAVYLERYGKRVRIYNIRVYADSDPGPLQNFILISCCDDLTPLIVRETLAAFQGAVGALIKMEYLLNTDTNINYRDEWVSTTDYKFRDAVMYGGSCFYCHRDNSNTPPDPTQDTAIWGRMALKGDKGDRGPEEVFHDGTLTGTGAEEDILSVSISADSGNLLEKRSDGLYYGIQAPDDVSNLYIDSTNGSDTGTGSQADPLRSIAEAARRVRPDQSNTLHLKAGQTFTLTENITVSSGAVRTLTVYDDPWIDGDKVPDKSPQYPNYMGWSVAQVNRPVIKPVVMYDEVGEFYSIFSFNAIGGGSVGCYAIAFDLKPDNDIDSTGRQSWLRYNEAIFYGSSGGTAMFYGCTFTLPDIPAGAQGTPSGWWKLSSTSSSGAVINTQFSSCHWNEGGGAFLVQCAGAGVSVFATNWPSDTDNPIPPPGTKLVENILTRLPAGGVSGIVRGASNVPRNVSANMVL